MCSTLQPYASICTYMQYAAIWIHLQPYAAIGMYLTPVATQCVATLPGWIVLIFWIKKVSDFPHVLKHLSDTVPL